MRGRIGRSARFGCHVEESIAEAANESSRIEPPGVHLNMRGNASGPAEELPVAPSASCFLVTGLIAVMAMTFALAPHGCDLPLVAMALVMSAAALPRFAISRLR